ETHAAATRASPIVVQRCEPVIEVERIGNGRRLACTRFVACRRTPSTSRRTAMSSFKAMAVAAAVVAAGVTFTIGANQPAEPVQIKIIGLNDFHGNIAPPAGTTRAPSTTAPGTTVNVPTGGVAFLKPLLDDLRAQNPLNVTVAAGDLIGASPLVSALFH